MIYKFNKKNSEIYVYKILFQVLKELDLIFGYSILVIF